MPLDVYSLLDNATLADPYRFYEQLRGAAPVWRVPGRDIFVVSDYALVDEAARRIEDFSSNLTSVIYRDRKGAPRRLRHGQGRLGQILATADPPLHGKHKLAVAGSFSPRKIAALTSKIETLADSYVEKALAQGRVDFMSAVANPLPMRVVCDLVGFPVKELEKLLQAAFDSTAIVGASLSLNQLLRCIFRSALVQIWMHRQLQRTSASDTTILASIKQCVDEGVLTIGAGRGILHTFLAAGGESTTSLLGNAVRLLADDPVLQDQLRRQPELVDAFVEEVLRLESPFRFHLRSSVRKCKLGEAEIPAGATVLLFWAAANRDPDLFPKPDTVDLTRPRKHLAFGRGIHTCIGASLARLEAATVIRLLLARTQHVSLDAHRPPQWVESLQVRRYQSLPIVLTT